MSTKGRNNMGNSSDSDGDASGNIKQLPMIKGGGSNMNMMNMQHMNNSFHHNSSQISETTYSMKADNALIGGKKKNSSTFNTSKYMAHSPSPSQTFFKGKLRSSSRHTTTGRAHIEFSAHYDFHKAAYSYETKNQFNCFCNCHFLYFAI